MLLRTYYLHKLWGQEPILCIISSARNLLSAKIAGPGIIMLSGTYLHKMWGKEPIICINCGARNLFSA